MRKKVWIAITVGLWLVSLAASQDRCARAWFAYGIDVESCPDGELRQSALLEASSLRRGAPGRVTLQVLAHYTTDGADAARSAPMPRVASIALSLAGAKNAVRPVAAATVLRVSEVPALPELDAVVDGRAESPFDPIEELTDRFYVVLAELHAQVGRWEAKAPETEKMTPATMARLWQLAIGACRARGARVDDAYGRTLRLSRLPPDLLSLIDPRAVVVVATRSPKTSKTGPRGSRRRGHSHADKALRARSGPGGSVQLEGRRT